MWITSGSKALVGAPVSQASPLMSLPPFQSCRSIAHSVSPSIRRDLALAACFLSCANSGGPLWSAFVHVSCRGSPVVQLNLTNPQPGRKSNQLLAEAGGKQYKKNPGNPQVLREWPLKLDYRWPRD